MMQFILNRKKSNGTFISAHAIISRSRTKSSLLENGWTLNEIENTDLNELLKIYAFKDAVDEFENIKYLDENTMF